MYFAKLIQDTLATLAPLGCSTVPLPDGLAQISRDEVDGVLTMATQFIAVADRGQLRIVHIHAPKINIVTLFFFPHSHWQLPVYCLELVMFGTQPIIGLLDSICLLDMACAPQVGHFMKAAHQAYPHLQQSPDTPEWFQACRSGQDFFLRPQHMDDLAQLGELHLGLLQNAIKPLLATPQAFDNDGASRHQQQLQHFKHHHRINAPGLRLMNRSFGEAWTHHYMNTLFQ
jgi:hypothetical protein